MNGIIVGAGEVGFHIADRLSREGHNIVVIEQDAERRRLLTSKVNALVVHGSGASTETLERAGIQKADIFIAVTNQDEVNLVACLLATQYNVGRKIARVRSLEYHGGKSRLDAGDFGIDLLINPQRVVAEDIVDAVRYTRANEVAEFADGRIVFLGYSIEDYSPVQGVALSDLGEIRGMYPLVITAIDRNGETIIPRGDDRIEKGDIVFFVCNKRDLPSVRYLFGVESRETRKIFLLGGGGVGLAVARILHASGYEVKLIDQDAQRCNELADELEGVLILNAGATDIETMLTEGIDEADVFIAVTNDDQTNILSSLLVKRHGTKRVIALVDQPELLPLATSIGVDVAISPRLATASAVLRYVRSGEVLKVAPVDHGNAEVLEVVLPEKSKLVGKKLMEVRFPEGAIVGAIMRGQDAHIPNGDDMLERGDRLIVFALPSATKKVERFLS